MKKINRIIVRHLIDENPDLSHLGKFSDTAGEFAIKHSREGYGEYKYFNADNVEDMKQAKQNYKLMIDYNNGVWGMIGIRAEAEIITGKKDCGLINTIKSGGLWGISNDCDDSEFKSIEEEQVDELKDVLRKLGFSKLQVEKAKIEVEGE